MSDEKKIDDGGPAFPWHSDGMAEQYLPTQGMSLRDYFAGQALQAIITGMGREWPTTEDFYTDHAAENCYQVTATDAYAAADAMLAARTRAPLT